ncbi:hypothetical protein L2E82_44920 [Cichorium intybus]|uniref:Uncharacterized protein n=1 Tax=Cichorium intybus TaxID=13427 RepID=A0ACB8ZRG0_CICIN|nr:hypothetical protein L2E82_44920 [Cichorium intybus]
MERLGLEYFDELLSRSFFQHSSSDKSMFVMHDLMNDLAMSVAGDFFSRSDIGMKKEFRKEALEMIAICHLKKLKNLHGEISIWGLANVQNAMDACEANLSQKRLSKLELDWGSLFNLSQTETYYKEVLNELKPHNDTLKQLHIKSYRGIEFSNWVRDPSFLRLTVMYKLNN